MIIRPLFIACALAAASSALPALAQQPAGSGAADTLVTVNGRTIKRSEVQQRLWTVYANDTLNAMVDETVVEQNLREFADKASKKEKDAWKAEVDARLKKIRDQFKDETAFNDNLKKAGTTLEDLRARIEDQVKREEMVIQADKLKVTPEEVKAFFDSNKDKLSNTEAVHLRHVLVADEKQAKDILVAVRVGADFGKLAQQLSLDTASRDRGGDIGFISRGMLIPEIEKVAFSLKPGEVSDVIKTSLGYHVIKVEEKREAKPAVFKDIEKDLTVALLAQKINQAWPAYVKSLRDKAKIELSPAVRNTAATPAPGPAPAN